MATLLPAQRFAGRRPLSLCFVHHEFRCDGFGGGVSTYHEIIARTLASWGHRVTIVAARGSVGGAVPPGVRLVTICPLGWHPKAWGVRSLAPVVNWVWYTLSVAAAIRGMEKAEPFDVVECADNGAECFAYTFSRKRARVLVRCQYPSFMFRGIEHTRKISPNHVLLWLLERWQLLRSDRIVCSSRALKNMVKDGFRVSRPIRVIPLPVEIPAALPRTVSDRPTVLYAGKLTTHKGVLQLLHSVPKVVAEIPKTRFIFIGRGSDWFLDAVRSLDPGWVSAGTVQVLPPLSRQALSAMYACADLCVFPSLVEPFGYTCAEAMAVGACVIGSRGTGHADLIEHQRSGWLVDPGRVSELADAILTLLKDESLRRRLGEEARERIRCYFAAPIVARIQEREYYALAGVPCS